MSETVEEQAARLAKLLTKECEYDREPGDARGFALFIWKPGNKSGAITHISNFPRPLIMEFVEEWLKRMKEVS